mmetsp:Transcript_58944/g.116770  ORF Transcript_58944/g.116770 Transcript_58944/m.116770 type:complete len:104 (+) Transcript_58944:1092-1403(+)
MDLCIVDTSSFMASVVHNCHLVMLSNGDVVASGICFKVAPASVSQTDRSAVSRETDDQHGTWAIHHFVCLIYLRGNPDSHCGRCFALQSFNYMGWRHLPCPIG